MLRGVLPSQSPASTAAESSQMAETMPYYIIAPSEASSNLARYDGVHYGYRSEEKSVFKQLEAERRDGVQSAARRSPQ